VSTAENAERPVGPPASPSGPARRASRPADGGSAGGRAADSGALRRTAGGDAGSNAGSSGTPTTPVPAARAAAARPSPAASPATQSVTSPTRVGAAAGTGAPQPAPRPAAARRVRLTVSRVDPWSAMKISFLLSVALGIAGVVMVFVLWTILAGMGVFDQINGIVGEVVQDGQQRFDIMDFVGLGRVVSLSIVIAVIDVILITAIATLGAFLYNVSSALVGGVQLTLTDD